MNFVFNVKGLTAADRAQWEKDNIEALKGTDYFAWNDSDRDRAFRDASFKNKYGSREDYNTLYSYTPEQRDSIFNLDLGEEESLDNIVERNNVYSNVKRSSQFKGTSDRYIKDFNDIANSVTPYYKRYLDTDYLPWNEEDKIDAYARYQSILSTTGSKEMADKDLATTIQNQVSKNQPPLDKWLRGANKASASIIGTINTTLGFLGGLVASPILSLNGYNEEETEDLNAWQTYWHNVVNNPYNKFWNRVMNRGTLNRDILYSDNPEDNYDRNEIINTVEQDDSLLKFIFSENFLPNMVSQSGFTIGSMASGQLLSRGIGGLTGWRQAAAMNGVNTADELANALDKVQKLAQTERRLNAYLVPAIVGSTEGVVNALNTYDNSFRDFSQQIENETEQRVQAIKEVLLSDPDKMQELGYNATTEEGLEAQIRASLAPAIEDMYRKAREEAAESELTNFTINSFINGAGNVFLKSPMLGGRVKESIGRTKIGKLFSSDRPRFNYTGGNITYNVPSVFTRMIDGAKETFGETSEEYLQEISDSFAQGWGAHSMENFIARRFNGESYEAIEDSLAEELGAALKAAGESAVSKEAIKSGVLGGLSQAMGTATVNLNAFNQAKNAKTKSEKVTNFIRTFWRNPFLESSAEFRAEKAAGERAAEAMNNWLHEGNNMERFKSTVGAASWIREMNEYDESGDEFSYRNSKFGKLLNDAFMVHELRGTQLYDAYIQQFMDIINAEEGTELASNIEQSSGVSLAEAKKHAQDILDNVDTVTKELEILEENIGKHANDEVKKALIYGKLSELNLKERGEKLESEINQGYITEKIEEERRKLARGKETRFKIEALEKEAGKLDKEIQTSERNINTLSKQQKRELNNKKSKLKTLNKQIKSLQEEDISTDSSFLTKGEILGLNAVDRYIMLNPKNRKFYNEEQLAVIDNLINEKELNDINFMQKIEDAARIEQARAQYAKQYSDAIRDPGNLNRLTGLLNYSLTLEQKRKQYSSLNNISNKEEFLERFNEEWDNIKDMLSRQILVDTVKDNSFYKEIMQSKEDTEDFNILKEYNEQYQKMEDKQKKQIEGVLAFLETKNLNPKDLEAQEYIANNPQELETFVNNLNAVNPENQIEFENAGDLIGAFQELFGFLAEEEREKINVEKRDEDTQVSSVEAPAPVVVDNNTYEEKEKSEEQDLKEKDEDKELNPVLENAINIVKNNPLYKDKIDAIVRLLSDIDSSIDRNKVIDTLLNIKTEDVLEEVIIGDIIKILQGNTYTINAQEGKTNNREAYKAIINLLTARELEANDDYTSLRNFYTIYEIDRYLQTAMLSQKDKIRFVYDPTLASQVKSDKQERFAEIDTPIIAVVFTGNGPLEIEGKKGYQPIGVLPNVQGKEEIIKAIKGNSRQFIRIEDSIVETTINGYIHTKAPEQIPRTEPNMPIAIVAFNDESPATKEVYEQSSIEEKTALQKALRDKILSHLVYVEEDSPNTHTKEAHLAYEDTDGRQNVTSQIDITIAFPEETITIDRKSFKDVLLNGTDEDLLRYNSRVYGIKSPFEPEGYGLGNVIRQFFEATPFRNIREGDTKALEELSEKLKGVITNYISLPTSGQYKIVIEPTTETRGGFPVYSLRLKGPSRLINNGANTIKVDYDYELGKVYDGTLSDNEVASIIRNIFLDENKNFRKYSYKGKEMPLIKWQVNISDFNRGKNANTSAASKHREDVYNDNILTISKRSLRRQVTEVPINNPIRKSSNSTKPDLSIANTDNAEVGSTGGPVIAAGQSDAHNGTVEGETGVPLGGKPDNIPDDTVKRTLEAVRRIKEGARKILRRTDGKAYTSGGSTLSRVTSIIKDKDDKSIYNESSVNPATTIGTAVDDFFRETIENKESVLDNTNEEDAKKFKEEILNFKQHLENEGFSIIAELDYPDGTIDGVRTKGFLEV